MRSSNPTTIGWDLGGVHVKVALVEDGRVAAAAQVPCPLWQGLPALDRALEAAPDWARGAALHAVTMTGELTDCFADRRAGVAALAGWAGSHLAGTVRIYAGRSGFVAPEAAASRAADVASANWHATAALAGRHVPDALLIDIGSTTADLIPVAGGRPAATGYSDAERLETGELVYTGAVRTPVIALSDHAPFAGRRTRLMTETFAHMADVYRILGLLPEGADQQPSGDRKGKTVAESETRLARIVGRDRAEAPGAAWTALAAHFAEAQLRLLHDAAAEILSRPDLGADAPLVLCGAGAFVGARLAERLGRPSTPLAALLGDRIGGARDGISTCGPAVAVGLIAAEEAVA
ncbi:hydantoinase/oxoprolinase family protein [Methylobacterium radiotolerans]|uniref:H4MPT-linked C1 transfer pathway protein n=1 Tax=Methylobacterium radiotolerans (strain ATCC 27329 / DSM 1819 / JCM 2831 / NBRC 15690 / NCIMB 10815 / 0-1) TaxID=426355 RepID=B1LZS7_METRJ|nr:hydantoinase/oxoprolinase family protein [Methylobacterium radiotolerans]ACB22975.1 H4MPT-linked C1 transfer pathway protein [Methylobacterium radiotolerans JCM 2831]KTS09498.1 H4MPT-linked C1 transfer pathway protein [Methylobacterium radiotolerans]KTS46897.1 H4MPT-linked C1 transfer pathway protein [Methylobacterium radiotolerans]GEN00955.1 ATP synthase subunit C [Methylobacterium radiotolerans]